MTVGVDVFSVTRVPKLEGAMANGGAQAYNGTVGRQEGHSDGRHNCHHWASSGVTSSNLCSVSCVVCQSTMKTFCSTVKVQKNGAHSAIQIGPIRKRRRKSSSAIDNVVWNSSYIYWKRPKQQSRITKHSTTTTSCLDVLYL